MGNPSERGTPSGRPDQADELDPRADVELLTKTADEWRRRFNAGDYYGAHEAAEDGWHAYRGPVRDFLKGLVQLSVSLHHHFAGNRHGAEVKWHSSRAYLVKHVPECLGIDVGLLLTEVERFYQSEPPGEPQDGTTRPQIS